ncbi:MAG: TMEM200 family protein [Thaumarchaeota archaeon]|nr:TMEM200 family protein [Nitrososphaerota archaeon]
MSTRKITMILLGLVLLLLGVVFALQGEGMVGGSSLMDNNPNFVYIGSFVALVGIVLAALGIWPRPVMNTQASTSP